MGNSGSFICSAIRLRRCDQKLSFFFGGHGIIGTILFMEMGTPASVSFLANYLLSFSAVHSNTTCVIEASWATPEPGTLKENVDAGWDAHSRDVGISIIVHDYQGSVVLAEWKFIPNCGSAEEAEILACLVGLKHLIDLRRWPATVESD
jgi:hypothetical protein